MKITSIFSFGTNEENVEGEEHMHHLLERIITEFNEKFAF